MIASTVRTVQHVDLHHLFGRIDTRDNAALTEPVVLAGIVDRIGGGDAFAAGVLHALERKQGIDEAAHIGVALAALKHSLPGDASFFRHADLDAYLTGKLDVRR